MNRAQDGGPVGTTRLRDQIAVVLKEIPAGSHATGIVRVQREEWRAENESEDAIPVGAEVRVLRVDGTRVVVRAVDPSDPANPVNPVNPVNEANQKD
jgi:membrane-bound ClpP family serine protease